MSDNRFVIPANRLKENDLIELDDSHAVVVSAYDWRETMRLKIVKIGAMSIESLDLPLKKPVTVLDNN